MSLEPFIILALALPALMSILNYAGYLASKGPVSRAFGKMARETNGTFHPGSFFTAPTLTFTIGDWKACLSSFYLYRGRRGNYTQLSLSSEKYVLAAFELSHGDTWGETVQEDRNCPFLDELLRQGWSEELDRMAEEERAILDICFDGTTLTVRRKGLLLDYEGLLGFTKSCERLLSIFEQTVAAENTSTVTNRRVHPVPKKRYD